MHSKYHWQNCIKYELHVLSNNIKKIKNITRKLFSPLLLVLFLWLFPHSLHCTKWLLENENLHFECRHFCHWLFFGLERSAFWNIHGITCSCAAKISDIWSEFKELELVLKSILYKKEYEALKRYNPVKSIPSFLKTHSLLSKHLWLKSSRFQKCHLHLEMI